MSEKNPRRKGLTRKQEARVHRIAMKYPPTCNDVDFLCDVIRELREQVPA